MQVNQDDYDRGPSPWFMCPRCMKQSSFHKYKETGVCPHCGDNHKERKEKEWQDRREKIRKEVDEKWDKREKNRLAYKPSKKDLALCKRIINEVVNHWRMKNRDEIYIHGWHEFVCLYAWNEDGRIANLEESITYAQILRAMKAGKHMGWITSKWTGVGMTPYAGAGRRTMEYKITDKGKETIQKVATSEVNQDE